ncbi:MAG: arsenosugar biosynthesis radical SAM protein ArsS [Planctomycetota bacterium]|nr:arsenosugar biosynthesis radical SAM protein ArsS [Planctomycetota bacterium]
MPDLTLLRQQHPLANPVFQVVMLDNVQGVPSFAGNLRKNGLPVLSRSKLEVLQVNLGRVCNQTCRHCHVDAGPDRRESMSRETLEQCLKFTRDGDVPTVDVTGGAPEMHPDFRWFVRELRALDRRIIDRCNLTILLAPGFDDLPEFLASNQVEIVASLPCYLEKNVDRQRGDGVFEASLEALQRLNALGYGDPGSGLVLNLVYNPLGPSLPPAQEQLEEDYRRELASRYGIVFNRLFTITNLPISRFLVDLVEAGKLDDYLQTLAIAFNRSTVANLMCRSTLSVDWQGRLFDCDFNQMLDLDPHPRGPATIGEAVAGAFEGIPITTGQHCYGCTAGSGSSCQGALSSLRGGEPDEPD